ncbi:acetyl-CoA carboxylase biotin carboxyl carrier protein [Saccharothrix algeriensis]|uniref:Biotin carboxyl carrier protein of acetyl-CoA carboxylase n=1 Tax=Saccharothrix algeriensis TaxID=173560 RepID=A0ABS2S2B7_9PSEU|nr:acetyl-CoA carboxylase biotin carboxyl carrier protein [Saccharothrix algeriensis]MBM7810369.1 acetyl-CoA carboxylase biotin carboxyl carrier protein [Saccharothrix algeriensis]
MPEQTPATLVEQVRELVELVHTTSVSRIRIESDAFRVEIEAEPPAVAAAPAVAAGPPAAAVTTTAVTTTAAVAAPAEPPAGAEVRALLVGVFYRCPAPGEPPFVEVGDRVEAGQQLGIVEAMKTMNPVTADRAGVVAAVPARDGEVVEFDQPLFVIGAS